eukprot:UN28850
MYRYDKEYFNETIPTEYIGIIQCRETNFLNDNGHKYVFTKNHDKILMTPKSQFTPTNGRSTLYFWHTLWSLWKPSGLYGSVLRSYVAQLIYHTEGYATIYKGCGLKNSEMAYRSRPQGRHLLDIINVLKASRHKLYFLNLFNSIWKIWAIMYKHGFITKEDLDDVQNWLTDLHHMNFFSQLSHKKETEITDTAVCFTGRLNSFQKTFPEFYTKLLTPNNADTFVHSPFHEKLFRD